MQKHRYLLVLSFLLTAIAPKQLAAQAFGRIAGTVTDQARAVVPNATVTAVAKATNFSRSVTTSASGTYSLPALPVGTYTVTATAPGFERSSAEVELDAAQDREVSLTLAVQGVKTKVEVSAAAPAINTANGTIGGLIQGRQVANLPLNGRDIQNLVLMQPGQAPETNSSFSFETTTAGNGNRGTTQSSYLDGMDSSDNELGGGQFGNFNLDAIAEVRVLQNNYSAEYGRGAGTILSVVSKSGTNEFHGSAFEFVRNDKLDARNFFAPSVAPFRRNEFGGTFGGPILLPKIYNGKNKTFFFFQYAGFRQRLATPVVFAVPTAEERHGIVNLTPTSGGSPQQFQAPITPAAADILNKYPLPNNPNGSLGPNTFQSAYSQAINTDQYSGRLDQRFSDNDSFYFRYSVAQNRAPDQDPKEAAINPAFSSDLRNDWTNAGLSETHLFSPTLINEIRISGMQSIEQSVAKVFDQTEVSFTDGALYNYGTSGFGFSLAPFTMSYRDNMSWVKGKHTMNFGAEYRAVHSSYFGAGNGGPNGTFFFAAGTPLPQTISSTNGAYSFPAGSPSPSSLVSFMLGGSQFYQRSVSYPGFGPPGGGFAPFSMRSYHWAGWFQDDYQISPKLTLNLGLRYEFNSVPYETGNRLANVINAPSSPLFGQLVLNPQPLFRPDYKGIAPRFGFAWKVLPKTVIRGGFAIFTNLPLPQFADQGGFDFPFAGTSSVPNLPFVEAPTPVNLPPLRDLKGNIVPANGNSKSVPRNTPVDLTPFNGVITTGINTDFHNGYTMSGNVTLERELPFNTILQVGYVFNNAVGLYASGFPNAFVGAPLSVAPYTAINPGLSEIQLSDNHAHSTYNSLQALFRKQAPTAGLTFQLSYTYSKAIDNSTTVENGDAANSALVQNNPDCWSCEKAASSFDVPQRVVANFSYEIPFAKAAPHVPKRLTNGWTFWGIATASSGLPFTVVTPYGSAAYGIDTYAGGTVRPFLVSSPTLKQGHQGPEEQYFSNAALQENQALIQAITNNQSFSGQFFSVPVTTANGSLVQTAPGNLGRNTFRSAAWSDLDLSLVKKHHPDRARLSAVPGRVLQYPESACLFSTE